MLSQDGTLMLQEASPAPYRFASSLATGVITRRTRKSSQLCGYTRRSALECVSTHVDDDSGSAPVAIAAMLLGSIRVQAKAVPHAIASRPEFREFGLRQRQKAPMEPRHLPLPSRTVGVKETLWMNIHNF